MLHTVQAHLGPDFTPDFTALLRPLERAGGVFKPVAGDAPSDPGQDPAGSTAAGATVGTLNSRADVIRAMDAICAYLERHEPTNPAPLLVRRARRLMSMNFLDIIRNMTPDGVNQVLFIAGEEDDTPEA